MSDQRSSDQGNADEGFGTWSGSGLLVTPEHVGVGDLSKGSSPSRMRLVYPEPVLAGKEDDEDEEDEDLS